MNLEQLREQFLNPADEFGPIPFWFWNDHLTEEEITRQIQDFKAKGVNGFVIHPRIGIPKEIEYLSDRFMELVACAVEAAEKLGMQVILYDEECIPPVPPTARLSPLIPGLQPRPSTAGVCCFRPSGT